MAQIQFLTAEPAERIPEYQEKWRRVDLGTQPIELSPIPSCVNVPPI
jgi:hypothetical protein